MINSKLQAGIDSLIERIYDWAAHGDPMPHEVASTTLREILRDAGVAANDPVSMEMQRDARARVADALSTAKKFGPH